MKPNLLCSVHETVVRSEHKAFRSGRSEADTGQCYADTFLNVSSAIQQLPLLKKRRHSSNIQSYPQGKNED